MDAQKRERQCAASPGETPRAKAIAPQIEQRPTESLRGYANNARRHSEKQIELIARSIREFGFNNPILVDDEGVIVAGHGRYEAALRLGLESVPTMALSDELGLRRGRGLGSVLR